MQIRTGATSRGLFPYFCVQEVTKVGQEQYNEIIHKVGGYKTYALFNNGFVG